MIISIDAGKLFEKYQYPFIIKKTKKQKLSKLWIGGNFFNLINAIYKRPTANTTHNQIKYIPPTIWNKVKMYALTTSFQHDTEGPS